MEALLVSPYVNIICMLAISVVMVTLLSLCACKSGEPREDVEGKKAAEKGLGKKEKRGSVKQKNDAVADTDVVIETEDGDTAGDKPANGRPLSHDRALPDLPMATARIQVDDEIEEDGHYNVVAKQCVVVQANGAASAPPNRIYDEVGECAGNGAAKNEENTDYAEVNDRGDAPYDPMYAGIMEAKTSEKCEPVHAKGGAVSRKDRHPYEAVDGIGNQGFTDFGDAGNSGGNDGVCRTQSVNTLESTLSVAAPPVPDKNFTDGEDVSLVTSPGGNKSSSPSLPPRNGTDGVVGGLVGTSSTDGASDAAGCVATSPTGKKKEPPYSRVTAREPLENLLRRQAEQSAMSDSFDPNYACVDYDQIKPAVISNVANQSADRNSLSSGFYAEIPSGDSSSLTYDKVGGGAELRNHAPTPPPLESLKHLSLPPGVAAEDDVPDPGYSSIVRKKPQTGGAAPASSKATTPPAANAATPQSPLYAIVNKRRTIHTDTGFESHPDELYAQVTKSKKNVNGARPKQTSNKRVKQDVIPKTMTRSGITEAKRAFFSTPGYQTIGDSLHPQTGAPPSETSKVGCNCDSEPAYDDIRSSQIMDLSLFNPNLESVNQNNGSMGARVTLVDNPDYESVDGNNDKPKVQKSMVIDPNYESVDLVFEDSKVKVAIVESRTEPDYEVVPRDKETEKVDADMQPPMMAAGGSTVVVGNGTSEQWQRREPIYQEIDEEKTGKEGKKKGGKASK